MNRYKTAVSCNEPWNTLEGSELQFHSISYGGNYEIYLPLTYDSVYSGIIHVVTSQKKKILASSSKHDNATELPP
jgi:hypothetical protein